MATTTKPMAKTTKATDKKRAPRSTSRKSAENGDQKKHYRPAPSLPMQNEGMLNMAIKAARDAGKIQVIAFRDRSNLQISNKSLGDYVTEVDKECERVIVETLKTAYPDHHSSVKKPVRAARKTPNTLGSLIRSTARRTLFTEFLSLPFPSLC